MNPIAAPSTTGDRKKLLPATTGAIGIARSKWTMLGSDMDCSANPNRCSNDYGLQKRLLRLYEQGEPVSELTATFGISRSTLFRTLKVLKQQPAPVLRG
jgi:Helix-turn-helix domain of resolvase